MKKNSFLLFASVAGFVAGAAAALEQETNRPNFIIIVTDDQRWDSMGVVQREMGANGRFPWYTNGTPNLDRLAAEGVRFRNGFVTLSLCSPSRACILTGKFPHLNGIISNNEFFPTNAVTYASKLREAGYVTGMFGKWHMKNQVERPGFDFSASFLNQGVYTGGIFYVNGVATPASTNWVDDITTDYALSFITSNYTRPFAVHIGFKTPHAPCEPPPRAENLYSDSVSRDVPNFNFPPPYTTKTGGESETVTRNVHRCITAIDTDIGRILDRLDQLGISTNTMIIFLGDNGKYHGEHGLADKRVLYEEAWRVPILVRYPQFPAQSARDEYVLNLDIAPTILDFASVAVPPDMQGQSWRPLIEGGSVTNWRQSFLGEYFIDPEYATTNNPPTCAAVRTPEYKLVLWAGHPDWSEMFNLTMDPYETNNLFNLPAAQAKRNELRAEFDRLAVQTGLAAQLAIQKLSNSVLSLSLTGGKGPRYQFESSTNLQTQTWDPLYEIRMDGWQFNLTDTNAVESRKFYRVRWISGRWDK